jgi:tetratricopeptide (TPR) repeat protein
MLAKNPDQRYQTPTEVIEALRAVAGLPTRDTEVDADDSPLERPQRDVAPPAPQRPEPPPEQPAKPARPPRPSKSNETKFVNEDTDALDVTPQMRDAAGQQFAHATEVIRSGGDLNYAQQLLLSCCKLDPANLMYRKMLREVTRDMGAGRKGSWFGSLTNLPARGRLKKARHTGDHRKALECGEELLCRTPGDVSVQLEMARSAEELGLAGLAVWLLEEARAQDPKSVAVLRELGEVFERQNRLNHAIAVWEKVRELVPDDPEATDKIRELSVKDTLSRGNFRG